MHDDTFLSVPTNQRDDQPVLGLLPPGTRIPPRYQRVCAQLAAWGLPDYLVPLGLVMRPIERGLIAPAQLEPLLGGEAVAIARALVALNAGVPRLALQPSEPIWKLFMLTYLHPAASVLKIAELLTHLSHVQDANITVPTEMMTAAAHVCARLGMWDVRAELLNVQARLADPHLVRRARDLLDRSQPTRTQFFEALRQWLADLLRHQGIAAHIERRPRPIHQVVEEGLESIQGTFPWADVVVLLIDNVADCYRALGAINMAYPVVGANIRDFIGGPKENGYQAIHTMIEYTTALNGERTAPVAIRIATSAMDRYNRDGYLAYLAGVAVPSRRSFWWTNRQRWLAAYQEQSAELFCFTPKGEAIFLPRGATVLDFAVRVHSNLGVYCRGARVNGYHVSPGEKLAGGDICEVLIDQYSEPIQYRLLDLASTTMARARIRRALQKDHTGAMRGQHIFRAVLTRSLEEQEVHTSEEMIEQQVSSICRGRGYQTVEAFYRAVARGEAAPDQVVRMIIGNLLIPRLNLEAVPDEVRTNAERIRLALCCRPRPSQPTVVVPIHNGHELKVHAAMCSRVSGTAYPVTWKLVEEHAYVTDVLYESWDRPGLIHQITSAISEIGAINILAFNATVPEPNLARVCFTFEAPNQQQIDRVRQVLEQLPEQRNVDVRTVTLIDEGLRLAEPLDNPYGPQPVGRWPFFVGRYVEIRQILAQLEGHSRANHILIRGPKRIGKSSLLQHLSRYHLRDFEVPDWLDLQSLPTEELRLPRLLQRIATLINNRAGTRAKSVALEPQALAHDPIRAFGTFLSTIREHSDLDRFVILIDEFGVVWSRLQGSTLAAEFFDQWRALLSDETVYRHLAFIVVIPDQAIISMHADHAQVAAQPVPLRIGELGYPVRLGVLDDHDARDLITTPIRAHLTYQAGDLDLIVRETGGHPYYIHLVCGAIVTAVQVQQRKTGFRTHARQEIPADVVCSALEQISGHEDAFYHVLADSTPATGAVLRAVAMLTSETELFVGLAHLNAHLTQIDSRYGNGVVMHALEERPDLLVEVEGKLGIRVALVAHWLRSHA